MVATLKEKKLLPLCPQREQILSYKYFSLMNREANM